MNNVTCKNDRCYYYDRGWCSKPFIFMDERGWCQWIWRKGQPRPQWQLNETKGRREINELQE